MSQLLHEVSRSLFSSFKQLLDQLLPECSCWIAGSRKPFDACAAWSLTKQADFCNVLPSLPWILFSWKAAPVTPCSECTRCVLLGLSQQQRCSAAATHDRASWVGGGCEGCSHLWVQRDVTRLFPKPSEEQSTPGVNPLPAVYWLLCQTCCASTISEKISACN